MGLNNKKIKSSKKSAVVLILILIIITSLSILIVGALKILTATDTEYTINRNSGSNSQGKILGKFICYKRGNKLYQQKVEYNTDGSIKSFLRESEAGTSGEGPCTFDIPKGARGYEVTVVGGGGAGSIATRSLTYKEYNSNDCIEENITDILQLLNAQLYCKNTFTVGNRQYECESTYKYKNPVLSFDQFNLAITLKNSGNRYGCGSSTGTVVLDPRENCVLKYKKNQRTISIPLTNYSLYNKQREEIERDNLARVVESEHLAECVYKKPNYSVCVGSAGAPGEALTATINGSIYGENGQNKIQIKMSDIGNGGVGNENPNITTNGGDTVFRYWSKKSKNYKEMTITAKGGTKGSCSSRTISYADQVEPVESAEGVMPTSFELPSVFNFFGDLLHAGYYSNTYSANSATYFGASGASGYINDLLISNLSSSCEYKLINGSTIGSDECTVTPRTIKGTDGAPGAIIISW